MLNRKNQKRWRRGGGVQVDEKNTYVIVERPLKSFKAGNLSSIDQYCKTTVTRYTEEIAKSNMPACGNSHSLR